MRHKLPKLTDNFSHTHMTPMSMVKVHLSHDVIVRKALKAQQLQDEVAREFLAVVFSA